MPACRTRRTSGASDLLGVPLFKEEELSAPSRSIAKKSALYRQADRASNKTSPPRPSSRSRTRGCSTSCDSAPRSHRIAGAADRNVGGAPGHHSSPGDLQPVFEAMLENAVRICDAKFGNIYRWDGDALHLVAAHNTPPAFAEARRRSPFVLVRKLLCGRMVATKAVVHVADLAAEEATLNAIRQRCSRRTWRAYGRFWLSRC